MQDMDVTLENAGWIDDPSEVEATWQSMGYATVCNRSESGFRDTEHRDVFFWEEGEQQLFGRTLPAHRQTVGDCVSHGFARGVQDLLYMSLARTGYRGDQLELEIATEPTYGFSRVEVGGGRIRGDGSVGAWAAKAVVDYGTLRRTRYNGVDLSSYSGALARDWGRRGVPDELEPTAREQHVRAAALVTRDDEARAALYNLYPIPVCSGYGFTTQRNADGWCFRRGSWAHCMLARGICEAKNGGTFDLGVVIQQSWGESPTGPNEITLKTGRRVKLPQGCFLIPFETFIGMLSARDSFALSGTESFLPQEPLFRV